jgi:FtsH-binding integral membrane protein
MRYEMAPLAIESDRSERAAFIRRTYAHLAGAILAFIAIETLIFGALIPHVDGFERALIGALAHPYSWLIVMVAFIGVSYLANYWAFNGGSPGLQYAGLGLYVVAEALIFVPLLYVAIIVLPRVSGDANAGMNIVGQAGILTLCLFAGLTSVVFLTGKDFSFLGPIISIASFVALGVILCAILFPGGLFSLGLWFSVAMIVLAAASILYSTSNIAYKFRTDQHVAAALSLFASVALLFYYVLLALMQAQRR